MRKGLLLTGIAAGIALAVAALSLFGALRPLETAISAAFKPVAGFVYEKTGRIRENDPRSKSELVAAASSLASENASLKARIALLELEKKEARLLARELEFLDNRGYSYETARVIGRNPDNSLHSLIVDKGRDHGIKPGLAVITGEGIMVGKVIDAQDRFSSILLLDDNASRVAALILNADQPNGLIEGERGLSVRLELVPLGKSLGEGDLVVTSGLEITVPRGLLIGEVGKVVTSLNDLFQSAAIRPLADYSGLSLVSIIIPESLSL